MTVKSNGRQPLHVLMIFKHPVGGIKSYIRYVYKSPWFDYNYFTVILPRNNGSNSDLFVANSKINTKYIQCGNTDRSMVLTIFDALRKNRYDLVHSHGFTSGVCAAFPAWLYDVPHIMTSHDMLLERQFKGLKGAVKKNTLPHFFNLIDRIHSVSKDAQRNLINTLPTINTNKLVTIPNGIDISLYEGIKARDLHAEEGISKDRFLIGFLGRFMSPKGFHYLIHAIEILNMQNDLPRQPLIVAFGYGGFIREDRAIIATKRLESNFLFLPSVDNVAATLKGLDAVAMPSLWEACGLLAMEVLVSGVPLIASNCKGLREVTAGSPTFIVEAEDANSLAHGIRNCILDDRRSAFESYTTKAKRRFDAGCTSEQLQKLYHDVKKN